MAELSALGRYRIGPRARLVTEQSLVTGGQALSGIGNLVFSVVMARLLSPGSFADLAAFLAMYLLVHAPVNSLSAGSAVSPGLAGRIRSRTLRYGFVASAVMLAAAYPLASGLGLPLWLVVALAAAVPAAGPIALERGRLYGLNRHARAVASLVAEPAVRLTLGLGLALLAGATGSGAGVVVAGYAALAVAYTAPGGDAGSRDALNPWWVVAVFVLLAVVQNQDLLLAKGMLDEPSAATFAALSTLGGGVAFATSTIPLVFLARARDRTGTALGAALGLAVALGAAFAAVAGVAPRLVVTSVFGDAYNEVVPLAFPYLVAMGLFGVARVLAADACARGRGRSTLMLLFGAAVLQTTLIVVFGTDAASVAQATLVTTASLVGALGVAHALALPSVRSRWTRVRAGVSNPVVVALVAAVALAIGLRLLSSRSLWLDEATSVHQATMSFGAMIANLRDTDVHPPLYFAVLWATVRVFGISEWAVRLPSLVAGVLLVPMMFVTAREAYGRRAGLLAAVLGAVAPFAIWYSQEARMYELMMLFGLVALWAQIRAIRRGDPWSWVIYAAASAALGWTQYFGLIQVGLQQLFFAVVAFRRWRRGERTWPFVTGWLVSAALVTAAPNSNIRVLRPLPRAQASAARTRATPNKPIATR